MLITKHTTVLILSHYHKRADHSGGPPQEVRDYLLTRAERVYYLEHPFPYADDHRSSLTTYENGQVIHQVYGPSIAGPDWFFYIADVFISIYFVLRFCSQISLCIALDPLNTVNMLPFRWLGHIKKLVCYTIDYTPRRFPNKILNWIYQTTDKIACRLADVIWVLSPNLTKERIAQRMPKEKMAPVVLLPMGANLKRIQVLPVSKIHRYRLIFVGILLEKQGLQLVLEVLPNIIKKIKNVELVIVGKGEYEKNLKKIASDLHIRNHVKFLGFVKKHADVENLLCQSAIGIAPYVPSPESYTYYTDPGKPKLYMGCGLPVIITPVPAIAKVIQRRKAGLVSAYTPKAMTKAIFDLLTNEKLYVTCRTNAIKLSKNYDTDTLIMRALQKT